jgi:hypothetical protein
LGLSSNAFLGEFFVFSSTPPLSIILTAAAVVGTAQRLFYVCCTSDTASHPTPLLASSPTNAAKLSPTSAATNIIQSLVAAEKKHTTPTISAEPGPVSPRAGAAPPAPVFCSFVSFALALHGLSSHASARVRAATAFRVYDLNCDG